MKKKLTVLFAMAVAMMGLVALSGCSKDTSNTDIITMKGDSIKVIDLYNEAKEFPGLPTTTLLQNATFSKIFEKAYGKNVSDKDVADKVASYKTQYGAQFDSMLQQQNMTADSFNAYVRLQLLEQYAIDQNIQNTQMTDANIKAAWNNFHPDVEAYVVMKTTQADATAVKTAATSDAS
ncbi:MAG: foldase, partial [Streptococcaceae bacterium]|nr:foldase [Streptococcaceae bacterium]